MLKIAVFFGNSPSEIDLTPRKLLRPLGEFQKFSSGLGQFLGEFPLKTTISTPNLALREGHFYHFRGQKSRFLDFLKVVVEIFRSYFGIIFGLKMLSFRCIFSSKGSIYNLKNKNCRSNLGPLRGPF